MMSLVLLPQEMKTINAAIETQTHQQQYATMLNVDKRTAVGNTALPNNITAK